MLESYSFAPLFAGFSAVSELVSLGLLSFWPSAPLIIEPVLRESEDESEMISTGNMHDNGSRRISKLPNGSIHSCSSSGSFTNLSFQLPSLPALIKSFLPRHLLFSILCVSANSLWVRNLLVSNRSRHIQNLKRTSSSWTGNSHSLQMIFQT